MKRIIPFLLTLAMAFTLFPTSAWAAAAPLPDAVRAAMPSDTGQVYGPGETMPETYDGDGYFLSGVSGSASYTGELLDNVSAHSQKNKDDKRLGATAYQLEIDVSHTQEDYQQLLSKFTSEANDNSTIATALKNAGEDWEEPEVINTSAQVGYILTKHQVYTEYAYDDRGRSQLVVSIPYDSVMGAISGLVNGVYYKVNLSDAPSAKAVHDFADLVESLASGFSDGTVHPSDSSSGSGSSGNYQSGSGSSGGSGSDESDNPGSGDGSGTSGRSDSGSGTSGDSPAGGVTATSTASIVLVNGLNVAFDAYNIGGSNYFKLRDIALVLDGTPKMFAVGYDSAANAISLTSGQLYIPVGGELAYGGGGSKTAVPTDSKILLDGAEIQLTAYNIDGSNYFKLRDIGAAFDFGVDWDSGSNTIVIDTAKGYTP